MKTFTNILAEAKTLSPQMRKIAFDIIPLFRERTESGDLPFLIRERVVKMIVATLGHAKSFTQFSVPILGGLKFERPDWFGDFQEGD
jgi:hypothetical protein